MLLSLLSSFLLFLFLFIFFGKEGGYYIYEDFRSDERYVTNA